MKTKELIRQLQAADPSGELEAHIGGADILGIVKEPAYHNGPHEILVRDESRKDYNVIGAIVNNKGEKVTILVCSVQDALGEHPELPIEFRGDSRGFWGKCLEEWRQQARDVMAAEAEYERLTKKSG